MNEECMPMSDYNEHGFIFTPRFGQGSDTRVEMRLSANDKAKIGRGFAWQADVTDTLTGKKYRVWGAECSLPGCFCDAMAEEAAP